MNRTRRRKGFMVCDPVLYGNIGSIGNFGAAISKGEKIILRKEIAYGDEGLVPANKAKVRAPNKAVKRGAWRVDQRKSQARLLVQVVPEKKSIQAESSPRFIWLVCW